MPESGGIALLTFQKRDNGVKVVFFITIPQVSLWFIKIELKYMFYSFFYYFWCQHGCWRAANI